MSNSTTDFCLYNHGYKSYKRFHYRTQGVNGCSHCSHILRLSCYLSSGHSLVLNVSIYGSFVTEFYLAAGFIVNMAVGLRPLVTFHGDG